MKLINTIVVDDEPEAREGINILLEKDAEIKILSLCSNGIEAIDMIRNHKIDLMFLDIQMPMIDGFEVIHSVPKEKLPFIIFSTAYDQYALKAFEVNAVDYLLKPFTDDRFAEALDRAKQLIYQQNLSSTQQKLKNIASQLVQKGQNQNPYLISGIEGSNENRLIVKENGKIYFLELGQVLWVEAYDYYVKIHVKERFYLMRESLKKMEVSLPESSFIRIHKSAIINQSFIKKMEPIGNGEHIITLTNDHQVKVSRSYRDAIKKLMK